MEKREIYSRNTKLIGSVSIDEGTISSADSNKPIIATFGLGPCIALAGYDRKSKIGFISHNVPVKKLDNLNDPIFEVIDTLGIKKSNMEFYIIGGNKQYKNHVDKVKNYLNQKVENPNIVYEDIIETIDPKNLGKSFALDTRDQKIYSLDMKTIPDKAENTFNWDVKKYIDELK